MLFFLYHEAWVYSWAKILNFINGQFNQWFVAQIETKETQNISLSLLFVVDITYISSLHYAYRSTNCN